MEEFVVAVDDVKLEEKCVKEVVEVLTTAGLVALQHLAGTPTSMIEKLVARAVDARLEIVHVTSKLKTVALDSLPLYLPAQPALYQLLEADNKAAKDASPQHSAFTYACLGYKTRKSWKLLEHANCEPVSVVIPLVRIFLL